MIFYRFLLNLTTRERINSTQPTRNSTHTLLTTFSTPMLHVSTQKLRVRTVQTRLPQFFDILNNFFDDFFLAVLGVLAALDLVVGHWAAPWVGPAIGREDKPRDKWQTPSGR